jgi:hypothetical protein
MGGSIRNHSFYLYVNLVCHHFGYPCLFSASLHSLVLTHKVLFVKHLFLQPKFVWGE